MFIFKKIKQSKGIDYCLEQNRSNSKYFYVVAYNHYTGAILKTVCEINNATKEEKWASSWPITEKVKDDIRAYFK